jgi:uncharacterized surface protein with fasciclin (FAS1) repeats
MKVPRWMAAIALAGTLALVGAACGDDDTSADDTPATTQANSGEDTTSGMSDTGEGQAPAAEQPDTVVDVAASDQSFSTLVTAVDAAGLAGTLSGEGPFTVFAPVNDAFTALPAGTVDTLLAPENQAQLTSVLTYHVVPSKVLSSDLSDGATVTTVQGQPLTVGVQGDTVTLTDASGNTASVVQADVEAGNGVVHVIDHVLLPAPD